MAFEPNRPFPAIKKPPSLDIYHNLGVRLCSWRVLFLVLMMFVSCRMMSTSKRYSGTTLKKRAPLITLCSRSSTDETNAIRSCSFRTGLDDKTWSPGKSFLNMFILTCFIWGQEAVPEHKEQFSFQKLLFILSFTRLHDVIHILTTLFHGIQASYGLDTHPTL